MLNHAKGLKFVLAACPRSATAFSARLLSNLDLKCGHEAFFKHKPRMERFLEDSSFVGDASWLAVPFLKELPSRVRILHQTRHPLQVVRSLLQIRFFDLREDGQPVRQGLGLHFTQFAFRYCPELFNYPTAKEKAIWFYYHWNKRIEAAAGEHEVFRYAIEDLDQDVLARILAHLHVAPEQLSNELMVAHLEVLPRNINAKTSEKSAAVDDLGWDDLPNEVQELARAYGYGPVKPTDRIVDRWTDAVLNAQDVLRRHAQVVAGSLQAKQKRLTRELAELHQKLRDAETVEQSLRHELETLQRERLETEVCCERLLVDGRESNTSRAARDAWMCMSVSGSRVLDAWAGDGARARLLAREGLDVTALRAEAGAADPATTRNGEGGADAPRNLRWVNATIATLDCGPGSFDTVILSDLLTRTTGRPRLLERARRCLTDGGRLIVCVPLGYSPEPQRVYATWGWDLLELVGRYFDIIDCDCVHGYLGLLAAKPADGRPPVPPVPEAISAWLRKAGDGLIDLERQQALRQQRVERLLDATRGELAGAKAALEATRDELVRTKAAIEEQTRLQQRAETQLEEGRAQLLRIQAAHVRLARAVPELAAEPVFVPGPSDRGPIRQEGGILFFCTNGAGLGHLTRALAIARRIRKIDPAMPLYFLSSSPALTLISREKIVTYHIPPKTEYGPRFGANQWNELLLRVMRLILVTHRPSALVYDGISPYRGLRNLIAESRLVYSAMILRLRHKHDRLQSMLQELETFDEVLFPGETGLTLPPAFLGLRHRLFGPIIYLDREELLSRADARRLLQLPPDRKAVYVQLGAGNINDTKAWHSHIVSCLQKRGDVEIVLAESPISKDPSPLPPHVHVLSHYPNSLYSNAFDLAVCAAGYNTYHELMHFGVPAVLIPNQDTVTDDQLGRARTAEAVGAARVVLEMRELDAVLNDSLHDVALRAMRTAAMELVPNNSSLSVARHILETTSALFLSKTAASAECVGELQRG